LIKKRLLALFLAIVTIFSSISSARYELAIMLPKEDEDAINIVALGLLITSFLSIILLIIVIFFNSKITYLLDNQDISVWLYLAPISIFFIGIFNVANYYSNRKKYYKDIAKAKVAKSFVMAIFQLFLSFKSGAFGLIFGQVSSYIGANLQVVKNIIKDKDLLLLISLKNIKRVAKEYIDFPKYSIASVLASTGSVHFTNILISSFFSVQTLGFYSLVQRILGLPSSLIGGSIGQVFFQEASKEKQDGKNTVNIFKKTLKKLLLIAVPSFGILFMIVEDLFSFVFGEEWRVAGSYAKIVIPLFFIRFIFASLSSILIIYNKQLIDLIFKLGLLFISVAILLLFKLVSPDH